MGRTKRLKIGAGIAVVAATGVGFLGTGRANGLLFSPTTTTTYTGSAPNKSGQPESDQRSGGGTTTSAAGSPTAAAMSPLLGHPIQTVTRVADIKANYLDFDARRPNGKGFVVTVYQTFNVSELHNLTRTAVSHGSAWVGARDADLTSIYYRSPGGVGLWVGYYAPDGQVKSVASLTRLAARIAALPAVTSAAAR